MFFENQAANAESIKRERTIYGPVSPTAVGNEIAVDDIGRATAEVISQYEKHQNKKYHLTGPELISYTDYAKAFSSVLGQQIQYKQLPYEEMQKQLVSKGVPGDYAKALMELMSMRDTNPPTKTWSGMCSLDVCQCLCTHIA